MGMKRERLLWDVKENRRYQGFENYLDLTVKSALSIDIWLHFKY